MSNEKIKPKLNGTAETMLQCFYARAMHSRNPKNKFRDTKAEDYAEGAADACVRLSGQQRTLLCRHEGMDTIPAFNLS